MVKQILGLFGFQMAQEAVIAVGTTYVYCLNKVLWRGPPKWPKATTQPLFELHGCFVTSILRPTIGLRKDQPAS